MADTNVTPDGLAELEFIKKVFSLIEEYSFAQMKTEEARMLQTVANHVNNGGELCYKLMDKEDGEKLKDLMLRRNIPYTVIPDDNGRYAFFVRDIDETAFKEAQEDVYALDPTRHTQLTEDALLESAKRCGDKDVVELKFNTQEDFEKAQKELHKNKVVCAIDKENKTLLINSVNLYSTNNNDLVSFELDWAITQSLNDEMFGGESPKILENEDGEVKIPGKDSKFQHYFNEEAKYDMYILKEFAKAVKSHSTAALIDAKNGSATYLVVKNGELYLDGAMGREKALLSAREIDAYTPEKLGAFLSQYAFRINNPTFMMDSLEKINEFANFSMEAAKKYTDETVLKNSGGEEPLRKRNTLDSYGMNAKDKEILKFKSEIGTYLDGLKKAAKENIQKDPDFKKLSYSEKRDAYKTELCKLMRDAENEKYMDLINSNTTYLTKEEKTMWLSNIEKHFRLEMEDINHEVNISKKNVKERIEERKKEIEAEHNKNNPEHAQEKEDNGPERTRDE